MRKINNKIFVFLPIYNEGQSIINLLNNFIKLIKKTRLNIKIIVIDDKSIDHSALLLKQFIKKNNEVNIKIISHKKNKGLLIVIDELGKFLEYETRHFGTDNIFLLQELAELAFSKHKTKLALMVMLHQSIEQYARGLGATEKNEWAKIQGRFESINFIDTSEQTLRIVARAIEHKLTKTKQY